MSPGSRSVDLLDLDVLPLFVILVVPGFIAAKVYDLSVPGERRNWASDFLEVLVYGALNFGLWFWLIDFLVERRAEMVWGFRVGMGFVLLVSPIFLGAGTSLLLRWRGLRGFVRHPTPTAWDHFFQRRKECWVLCNLRNGQRVGGFYRQGSFAGASQNGRDLYIRESGGSRNGASSCDR